MLTRRKFLELCTVAGGAVAMRSLPWVRRADAAELGNQYFLFCYFSGGWDQLLALDPRDATRPQYQESEAYRPGGTGIYPAYDQITDAATRALIAANPSGVQRPAGSAIDFGPALPQSLLAHAQDFSVIRGVDMGTLTHEVGRRYFITGKFPRGLQASGSALPVAVAGIQGDRTEIPNLTVGVESYNETFPSFASGLQATNATDVSRVLRPLGRPLTTIAGAALEQHDLGAASCRAHELDKDGLVALFRDSRAKSRELVVSGAAAHFSFTLDPLRQTQEIKDLFAAFAIGTNADIAGPKGQAALAAQAFTQGISQAVSVQLANGIDDHDGGWATDHASSLRAGFEALGLLVAYLKNAPEPTGGSYWDRTTLLVFSEFARTPLVNGRGGRDHHLASSCLVAGPGLRSDRVVGATSETGMGVRKIDLASGLADDAGVNIRPADIHATLLASMGYKYDHISNQAPRLLSALLKTA